MTEIAKKDAYRSIEVLINDVEVAVNNAEYFAAGRYTQIVNDQTLAVVSPANRTGSTLKKSGVDNPNALLIPKMSTKKKGLSVYCIAQKGPSRPIVSTTLM